MALDWSDGDYARTAATLAPVAKAALDLAHQAPGTRLLDVGCGTGNVLLQAAARGAVVTGVDPSAGLLAQARERVADAGVEARLVEGGAQALPFSDAMFDVVVSVFGAIFAPDPPAAVLEMVRVVRPGGAVIMTSWLPGGPIDAMGRILSSRLTRGAPSPPSPWGVRAWIDAALREAGAAEVSFSERVITFTAASPCAWFGEMEAHHPVWRHGRAALGETAWDDVRAASVAALAEGNQDRAGFRVQSQYLMTRAVR